MNYSNKVIEDIISCIANHSCPEVRLSEIAASLGYIRSKRQQPSGAAFEELRKHLTYLVDVKAIACRSHSGGFAYGPRGGHIFVGGTIYRLEHERDQAV